MSTPAGWYDDGSGRQRWWDGAQWTDSYAFPETARHPAYLPAQPAPATGVQISNVTKNFWGVLSLIGGIIAILLAWVVFGLVVGIVGLIFGVVGLAAVKKGLATNRGVNIAGIVLSAVGIVISVLFLLFYLAIGAWIADEAPSPGTAEPNVAPTESAPSEAEATSNEFPIGDGYTMELTIRTETLDPPDGSFGDPPTEAEYSLGWGAAVDTDGQIAVVTATIRNTSGTTVPATPVTVALMRSDLSEYEALSTVQGFDLSVFELEVPANGGQSFEFAFAMPASEIKNVVVQTFIYDDLGEGHRITAFQPQAGQGCEEAEATELEEVAFWSCLQLVQ